MEKPSSASRTLKTTLILPPDTNQYDTLFGGKLMAYMDDVAAIAAMRHARNLVVTASTDSVDFLLPIKVGDMINIEGFVTYTHRTSMEIFVKVSQEDIFTGDNKVCATAFLTFVALDENRKPTTVPTVYPESEMEKKLYEGAAQRKAHRDERKKSSQQMAEIIKEA